MNTPTPQNPSQAPKAPSLLSRAKSLLPNRLTTALIGMGLIANTTQNPTTTPPVAAPSSLVQSGTTNEVVHVGGKVSEILVQPPENALRTQALQILNEVRKKRSFRNTKQQEDFFHILAALDQNVPLEQAVFIVETDGTQYLRNAPRKVLKEFKVDSYDLSRFIV